MISGAPSERLAAGIYAPANWTKLIVSNGSIDTTNAPASVTLIGADDLGNAPIFGQTDFTIAAPDAGQVTFDWSCPTSDLSGMAQYDPFGYTLKGILQSLLMMDYVASLALNPSVLF